MLKSVGIPKVVGRVVDVKPTRSVMSSERTIDCSRYSLNEEMFVFRFHTMDVARCCFYYYLIQYCNLKNNNWLHLYIAHFYCRFFILMFYIHSFKCLHINYLIHNFYYRYKKIKINEKCK